MYADLVNDIYNGRPISPQEELFLVALVDIYQSNPKSARQIEKYVIQLLNSKEEKENET